MKNQQMSVVPWTPANLSQVRNNITHEIVPHAPKLPQRAAIVHEVSSDEDDPVKESRDVDASSGLAVSVLPSSLTQT